MQIVKPTPGRIVDVFRVTRTSTRNSRLSYYSPGVIRRVSDANPAVVYIGLLDGISNGDLTAPHISLTNAVKKEKIEQDAIRCLIEPRYRFTAEYPEFIWAYPDMTRDMLEIELGENGFATVRIKHAD